MGLDMDLEHLHRERALLIAEIHDAFKGVTREGGVSWNEAYAIDDYASDEERERARASDTDHSWQELVDDPEWRPRAGFGGFSFLDPIGFRYYIAPMLIRSLREDDEVDIVFHLTLDDGELRDYVLNQWSMFTVRQSQCIARFLAFQRDWDRMRDAVLAEPWQEALDSYWSRYA